MSALLEKRWIQFPRQEKPKPPNCPEQQVPAETIPFLIGKYKFAILKADHIVNFFGK